MFKVIFLGRVYVGGVQYQKPYQMKEKLVVITGGASGIGFETAKNLASRGMFSLLNKVFTKNLVNQIQCCPNQSRKTAILQGLKT